MGGAYGLLGACMVFCSGSGRGLVCDGAVHGGVNGW